MYLLDTNVVSELRKPKPHGAVVRWIEGVADAELHVSAVTIGEIQAGIEITREQDEPKTGELEQWLADVSATFNVVPMDAAAFREWASVDAPRLRQPLRRRDDRGARPGAQAHRRHAQRRRLQGIRGGSAQSIRRTPQMTH